MNTRTLRDLLSKSQIEILYKTCQLSEAEFGIWLIFMEAKELKNDIGFVLISSQYVKCQSLLDISSSEYQ
jgi:hypothetical protein